MSLAEAETEGGVRRNDGWRQRQAQRQFYGNKGACNSSFFLSFFAFSNFNYNLQPPKKTLIGSALSHYRRSNHKKTTHRTSWQSEYAISQQQITSVMGGVCEKFEHAFLWCSDIVSRRVHVDRCIGWRGPDGSWGRGRAAMHLQSMQGRGNRVHPETECDDGVTRRIRMRFSTRC